MFNWVALAVIMQIPEQDTGKRMCDVTGEEARKPSLAGVTFDWNRKK
jgi:hypothetical protein